MVYFYSHLKIRNLGDIIVRFIKVALISILSIAWMQNICATPADNSLNFQELEITPKVGFPYKAALFPAASKHIVLFVPGSAFNKESWYELARKLQQKGVAAISVGGRSYNNVKSTLKYLRDKKYDKFSLIGASLGGETVTDVLSAEDTRGIEKLVVLAPYGGSSIQNPYIDKLFIIANEDSFGIYNSVVKLYEQSSKPKELYTIQSKKHAQHLFKTEHKDTIEQKIIEFIMDVK